MIATVATRIPSKAELLGDNPNCTTCGRELVIGTGANAACMFNRKLYCPSCHQKARDPQAPKRKRRRRGNWRRFVSANVPSARLVAAFIQSMSVDEKAFALELLLNMAKGEGCEVEGMVTA